ncbi:phospholipid-transporting ATPase ID-like [Sinocyclocheilus grahami]|uniref:phospholipid-transporting ATPase ID-like n=1 Tax=Sinocyclocheilus grahami TaxID=75366 RepID=UPI0007AD4D3C|nr:PREDICTED: phospholipid-transporting ATPase ID-like [Sinocyclocheilus grahami]
MFRKRPPPEEERRVRANDREYNEKFQYASNCIMTSKYNNITFLPVNLFEQFQEVANTYFLFLLILQLIPQISSLSWFTTIVPLVLVLSITAVKDATDDYFRHKSDNQVNNRQSQVLIGGILQKENWMNVRVGDIIKLENNQFVAADLLLLSSSEPHGLCYIETAELDGETNMKVRQSLSVTSELGDPNNLAQFDGEVVCEPPNNKLDRFCGTLYWKDCKYLLSNQNMLLRGCVLRNTESCYGLVIFAGPDTKLMQNSGRTKFKRTSIDRLMNTLVLWIFGFLVCMGVILAIGNAVWEKEVGALFQSFLPWDPPVDNFLFSAFLSFWSYVIILNTVVPISLYVSEYNPPLTGELLYKAQSPDEGALVTAARNFGFVFRSRTPGTVTTQELGKAVTYTLLAILDFNNIRKRMSVIVRNPEGRIRLYCKGADTVLFERLHSCNHELMIITSEHLNEYAGDGLRTLAVAYRDLSEEQWEAWAERFRGADKATDCRDDRLAAAYEEIEQDMMLLGATAIEDKLQEGVPETIAILSLANIKIWVLTGDKQETAVNIGYSCKMLTDNMTEIFIVNGHTVQSVREELRKARERMLESARTRDGGKEVEAQGWGGACAFGNGCGGGGAANWIPDESKCSPPQAPPSSSLESISGEFALIISGHSLVAAHIGVGISGQEGIQAVLASDYSFSQFRFLQRLLLVHGRWSYLRMCRFLCYFFYKNFAFTMVHFWFGFFCGFSAQTVYDQYFITLYNIVYTSLPVLAMGIFDQDVPEQRSLEYPKLYEPGQLNLLFNKREFFICIAQGIYTSVVLFFIPYGVLSHATQSNGVPLADYQTFAVTTATALVIVVSVQIALDTGYWTAINHFFIWGSLGTYFTILFAMHSSILFNIFPKQFHFLGSARNTLGQPVVWLTIALATVICIAPVLAFRFLKLDLKPQLSDTVRYTQLVLQKKRKPGGRVGRGVGGAGVASGSALGRFGRGRSRRSGYAFAHQEGFGELITSGKNMRLSSLALATFASRHSSSWIDTLRRKKHANSTHNTPPTGEDCAASSQGPPLSTSSSAAGEAGQACNEPVLTHSPDDIALSVIRCPEREVGESSTRTVQEAPFVWKGTGARINGASSPGPPPIAEETSSGE